MRRELPTHPHIDHLKKQAKDLLDAHKQGDAEALARIVTSLPSFANLSAGEAARTPFALHDAQSTIAREYGFPSWNDLRAEVERRSSPAFPEGFLRSMLPAFPPEVTTALGDAWSARGEAPDLPPDERPAKLPLVAFRDALLTPGAIAPIHVARGSSLAAIDAALATSPSLLAVFTQRDSSVEDPRFDDLYPVGCVTLVRKRVPDDVRAFIVVQGLWWASLEAIDPPSPGGFATAHLAPFALTEAPDRRERDALVGTLRERAHRLARTMPQPERVIALIDSVREPDRFADLIVANLRCAVAEKARYAVCKDQIERLRVVIGICDAQLGSPAT
jgi:hypothetical protein